MIPVQMHKFAKISSDLSVYTKKLPAAGPGPHSNCCLSLYLNIAGVQQGPGKCFWGLGRKSWKFLQPREWEP